MHLPCSASSRKQLESQLWLLRANKVDDATPLVSARMTTLSKVLLVLKRGNTVGRWDINTVSSDVGQVLAQMLCNPKVPSFSTLKTLGRIISAKRGQFSRWHDSELIPEETTLIIRLGTDDYLLYLRANATS
ncbi:hypothetical protein D9613_008298 [Agrocybe pediades]|uniref:Uncharacterized protein n=1 Tax=Agrocybe pediades TaxID=84607 RepID=A0A8H4QT73_9AGAR|nr:hypothetical protein D9613_008298 [Agrocybe pediades]